MKRLPRRLLPLMWRKYENPALLGLQQTANDLTERVMEIFAPSRLKYAALSMATIASIAITASCTKAQPSPTPTQIELPTSTYTPPPTSTNTPTDTATPTVTASLTPTPTPDPMGDPDGDRYITYFEKEWGSDPLVFTSFEELSQLPGSIYANIRVSEPFSRESDNPMVADLDELNSTVFQVVDPDYEIDDWGTPNYYSDDHLTFEVVLFPNARQRLIPMKVDEFPVDPDIYPIEVQEYLISKENYISNITDELRDAMLAIVNGTGEGYSTPARTDVEAIKRIIEWNQNNIEINPIYETYFPPYGQIVSYKAGDIFSTRSRRYCIASSTLLNAELKAIGIPSRIYHHISAICNPNEDIECDNKGNHTQNGFYNSDNWVIVDMNSQNPRSAPFYTQIIITDTFRDNSEADFLFWIYIIDAIRTYWPYDLLYYTFEKTEK